MTKSALRVLEIMEHIAQHERGCTHAEVARDLGIPKSSLTALMRDLLDQGYMSLDGESSRYLLGSQILVLSQAYLRGLNLVKIAQPIVRKLFKDLDEFVGLAIPKGEEYILICAENPASPLAHSLQIGERGPLFCSASGKALLAFLPESDALAQLRGMRRARWTPKTRTGVPEIIEELRDVRRRGVAYAREEMIVGVSAIAVPVFNAERHPIASLSVAMPTGRLEAAREKNIILALKTAANDLSSMLGWRADRSAT